MLSEVEVGQVILATWDFSSLRSVEMTTSAYLSFRTDVRNLILC